MENQKRWSYLDYLCQIEPDINLSSKKIPIICNTNNNGKPSDMSFDLLPDLPNIPNFKEINSNTTNLNSKNKKMKTENKKTKKARSRRTKKPNEPFPYLTPRSLNRPVDS